MRNLQSLRNYYFYVKSGGEQVTGSNTKQEHINRVIIQISSCLETCQEVACSVMQPSSFCPNIFSKNSLSSCKMCESKSYIKIMDCTCCLVKSSIGICRHIRLHGTSQITESVPYYQKQYTRKFLPDNLQPHLKTCFHFAPLNWPDSK